MAHRPFDPARLRWKQDNQEMTIILVMMGLCDYFHGHYFLTSN